MRFRGSTLLKYVLSYILILAVSFAGLYFILSVQLKSEYEKKIKNETALKLSNVSKMLSQRFTDIQTTNYLIENDMTFINARYSQSDYTRYLAVNELKKLATSNALIHDILYIDIELIGGKLLLRYPGRPYFDKNHQGQHFHPGRFDLFKGLQQHHLRIERPQPNAFRLFMPEKFRKLPHDLYFG